MKPLYRCMKCSGEWRGEVGPVACPLCGNFYVEWVNFEQMRKRFTYGPRAWKLGEISRIGWIGQIKTRYELAEVMPDA